MRMHMTLKNFKKFKSTERELNYAWLQGVCQDGTTLPDEFPKAQFINLESSPEELSARLAKYIKADDGLAR